MLDRLFRQFALPTGPLGRLAGWMMAAENREIARWTVSLLDITHGDRIMEIGFGPGVAIQEILRLKKRVSISGIDPSEDMLRQASRRNRGAAERGIVKLSIGTVNQLPYPGGVFNKVYSINTVELWKDPLAAMQDINRVLEPGGMLLSVFQSRGAKTGREVIDIWQKIAHNTALAGFEDIYIERGDLEHRPAMCVIGHKMR